MLEKILLSLFSFVLLVIAHIVVFRLWDIKLYRFRILELLWGIFAVIYTILAFSIPNTLIAEGVIEITVYGQLISYAVGLLIYALLFFSYLHPHYINERGISVRVCMEMAKFPNGQLSFEELLKKYDHENLIQNRVDDLVYGGFVEKRGANVYRLTKKGVRMAKVFSFTRRFLHCPPGY